MARVACDRLGTPLPSDAADGDIPGLPNDVKPILKA